MNELKDLNVKKLRQLVWEGKRYTRSELERILTTKPEANKKAQDEIQRLTDLLAKAQQAGIKTTPTVKAEKKKIEKKLVEVKEEKAEIKAEKKKVQKKLVKAMEEKKQIEKKLVEAVKKNKEDVKKNPKPKLPTKKKLKTPFNFEDYLEQFDEKTKSELIDPALEANKVLTDTAAFFKEYTQMLENRFGASGLEYDQEAIGAVKNIYEYTRSKKGIFPVEYNEEEEIKALEEEEPDFSDEEEERQRELDQIRFEQEEEEGVPFP